MHPDAISTSRSHRAVLAAVLCAGAALCQTPNPGDLWSPRFSRPGPQGRVEAIVEFDGEVVVGGEFRHVPGLITEYVATWDGVRWQALGNGLPAAVRALAVFNGQLYAGGDFGLQRWSGTTWTPLVGPTLFYGSPTVTALAVYGGQLWVGGQFDALGAQVVHGLARHDGTQWLLPPGANPTLQFSEPRIESMFVGTSGLLLGGEFDACGGVATRNVARWDGTAWRAMGVGTNRTVRSVCEFQGAPVVGGDFDLAGGSAIPGLARWNGTQWQAVGGGLGSAYGYLQAFAVAEHLGELFVGGVFTQAGGTPVANVARWDGQTWRDVGGGIGAAPGFTGLPIVLATVGAELYVGGDFAMVGVQAPGQALVADNIARWDGQTWRTAADGLGANAEVRKLSTWRGRKIAMGNFTTIGGLWTSGVAMQSRDGWEWIGQADGSVWDAVEFQGDLVVTGQFQNIGGVAANKIARWNGSQWSPFGAGAGEYCVAVYNNELYAGGVGPVRKWNGFSWQSFGTPLFGSILAMTEHQGALYIGGGFMGAAAPPNLVRWDGVTMTPAGLGTNGAVESLVSYGNDLVIGGRFTQAGGVPANNLAVLSNGVVAPMSFPFTGGYAVYALTAMGTDLFAGGDLGNNGARRRYVAHYDGAQWHMLGDGPNGAVFDLLADAAQREVWVAGWFFECQGLPAHNLARYEFAGRWQDLGFALPWSGGTARLSGFGTLARDNVAQLRVAAAPPRSVGVHVLGTVRIDLPFDAGVLVPLPEASFLFFTDARGGAATDVPIRTNLPPGMELFWQCWLLDNGPTSALAATNALRQTTP